MSSFHTSESARLVRGLTIWDASAIVVGTIIGTGIFLKTAVMSQLVGSAGWVIAAWVVAGGMSLLGALTYAEIGSLLPKAGGEYAYLREGMGSPLAFLYGWMRFWIASPGTVAAYGVGAATFLFNGSKRAAIAMIIVFTLANCVRVSYAGKIQTFLTSLKVLLVIGIFSGIFILSPQGTWQNVSIGVPADQALTWQAWLSQFGLAVLAALWAFDGWNNLPMVGEEIQNPQKNLPRALALGMLAVLVLYLVSNLAYFYALPFSEVMTSNSDAHPDALPVATRAVQTFMGDGILFFSFALAISAVGAMYGSILTSARVPYAMAKDGLALRWLANVGETSHAPITSILIQGFWSCILALSGSFDQLTDSVVFSSWAFYGLTASTVFVFRQRGLKPAFKVWGYPWVPAAFVALSILLVVNCIWQAPLSSLGGLGFILLGLPVYYYFVHQSPRTRGR